jgi:Fe-S-cluster-containing dehydrogenase component
MARLGMVIDLRRCIGCDACNIGCKGENNTQQGFFWAHHIQRSEGAFPAPTYTYMPTLCNHCEHPACVDACPVEPKAMFQLDDGIVMHSPERCIGCLACQDDCPYGVIFYNEWDQETHPEWRTAAAVDLSARVGGDVLPYSNPDPGLTGDAVRRTDVVEKCTFCYHRVQAGQLPRCVEVCPATARTFGDLDDPNSDVSRLLRDNDPFVLRPEAGTRPKVFYIRQFDQRANA